MSNIRAGGRSIIKKLFNNCISVSAPEVVIAFGMREPVNLLR